LVVVAGGDDLALYWNIRSAESVTTSRGFCRFPPDAADDVAVHRQIESWLVTVLSRTGKRPNACQIVSLTAERLVLDRLAAALRSFVARLGLVHVDVHVAYDALPCA